MNCNEKIRNLRIVFDKEKHKKTKILFISSGAVYGKRVKRLKVKETDIVSIQNVKKYKGYKRKYAISKIEMEEEFKLLSKRGYKVSIARLFSFIGNRVLKNKDFALTNLINQAKNKKIKISATAKFDILNIARNY